MENALRRLLNDHPDNDFTVDDLTKMVVNGGMIHGDLIDGLRDKALTAYISGILRKSKIETPDGETVRAFQNYTKFEQKDGREVQLQIWKDIDTMSRAQMLIAARERVEHVRDCKESLEADVRYWNANVRPKVGGSQIRLEW